MIAEVGHFLTHAIHPVHFSTLIEYVLRLVQAPAGHFLSKICASYSSLNQRKVLRTGFGADCPSPHKEVDVMTCASFSMVITPLIEEF